MNIYKVKRIYHSDERTTWHDSKMSAERIVKRHKRLGKKFRRRLDKLSNKYSPEKRQANPEIAEVFNEEQTDVVLRFINEHDEFDAPMEWAEMETVSVTLTRAGIVSLMGQVDKEWGNQQYNPKHHKLRHGHNSRKQEA